MSYDLMVFAPEAAPRSRPEFMAWYTERTEWKEKHSYDDPANCTIELRNWFMEMIETFPALNGPFAVEDPDDNDVTDYCIGKDVVYVGFSWSVAEKAYEIMKHAAEKHKIGFFDASADEGDILFPDENGRNQPIDLPRNLSSIQQIKNSAKRGQENVSVKDIIFGRLNLQSTDNQTVIDNTSLKAEQKWWQKMFGFK